MNEKIWSFEEIQNIYALPLLDLMSKAHQVHLSTHEIGRMQVCALISVKSGGCPENCRYCPQSSHYNTGVAPEPFMSVEKALHLAKQAIAAGASRVCLGAAWREVRDGKQFDQLLEIVKGISSLGVEVCCTLGMLRVDQAERLKKAGLFAYNHNLDTSAEYYEKIITTRSYQERLNTIDIVKQTGLSVCCGGILGMGESVSDRLKLLQTLSEVQPDSIPINQLHPVSGTPLADQPPVSCWEVIRMIATARIVIPKAKIRLSVGRIKMSIEQQTLCFLSGANSIFCGEKFLTIVPNTAPSQDQEMFDLLGLCKSF